MIGQVHEHISFKQQLMTLIISLGIAILIVAGCSGDNQTVAALGNMKIDQTLERRVIDPIITIERRH